MADTKKCLPPVPSYYPILIFSLETYISYYPILDYFFLDKTRISYYLILDEARIISLRIRLLGHNLVPVEGGGGPALRPQLVHGQEIADVVVEELGEENII